jgi:flagellar protein FlgJ
MDFDIVKQNMALASQEGLKNRSHALLQAKADQKQKEKQLEEACAGFEAIFINTILKSMRKSLPGNGVIEESHGMNIYQSMYDQYLSEQAANSTSSLGLKEFLYEQLKKDL